jgi:hypothetical protein
VAIKAYVTAAESTTKSPKRQIVADFLIEQSKAMWDACGPVHGMDGDEVSWLRPVEHMVESEAGCTRS